MKADNLRYEVKMIYESYLLPEIRAQIDLHPTSFVPAYPPRRVNNVYFDTPDLTAWHDNLNGTGNRRKLRLRWYGADYTAAPAHLELKCKEYMVGWKELDAYRFTFDLTTASWREIQAELWCHASPQMRNWLELAGQPTLLNHYRREYYVSSDGAVRLTLDYAQAAYDQRGTMYPNVTYQLPLEDCTIVEFKADSTAFSLLSHALAQFPTRSSHHSKYAHGVGAAVAM